MKAAEFEDLITRAGLNLLSTYAPRFVVSLHVPTQYGTRRQTAVVTFVSLHAMEAATTEECQDAITEIKRRMVRASKTQQGDMVPSGEVKVKVAQESVASQTAVKYPAH